MAAPEPVSRVAARPVGARPVGDDEIQVRLGAICQACTLREADALGEALAAAVARACTCRDEHQEADL